MRLKAFLYIFTLTFCISGIVQATDFSQWQNRLKITFSGYTTNDTLADFPVLVKVGTNLTGFSYAQIASVQGYDIRFSDETRSQELSYEIDKWDTNGTTYIWVKVPELKKDSAIWMYWGNPEQTQQQTYTTNGLVWTENYKGVWHLREDETNYSSSTISYKDATTNHYNGTYSYAGTVQPPRSKAGKIAEGQEFRGPGYYIGDGIACGTALNFSSNDFTISVWVNPNAIRTSYFMSKDYSWNSGYDWYFVQSGTNVAFYGQSNLFSSTKGGFAAGQWTQVSFVRENNNGYLYANGEKIGGPYDVSTMVLSNSRTLRIGRRDSLYAAAFGGSLDEIQISGTARSPAWLRAAWLNQTSNSVFQTYSTVHMQGPIFMGW